MCFICKNKVSFNSVFYKAFNPVCNNCRLKINYDYEKIEYKGFYLINIDIFTTLEKELVEQFIFEIIKIFNIIRNNISKTIVIFNYQNLIYFEGYTVLMININVNNCRNLKY